MKTVMIAIMAVLIFGVAASPIFSNGFAYAEHGDHTDKDAKVAQKEATAGKKAASEEIKSERDTERNSEKDEKIAQKEATAGKKAASEEIKTRAGTEKIERDASGNKIDKKEATAGKKAASEEIKSERDTDREAVQAGEKRKQNAAREGDEQREKLKAKFANMSEEKQTQLTDRLDAMKSQRASITPSFERTAMLELTEEDRALMIQEIREQRATAKEAEDNMSPEDKEAFLEEKRADMAEKRANSVNPRDQIALGLEPTEVICIDDYELVIRASNGMPVCMASDTAAILFDRGFVTYPEIEITTEE